MVNTEIGLIIFFAAEDGEVLYSQQKQDQELTVAQILNFLLQISGLNLKEVWKITRLFENDLNQIPYDYTMEVMNRFKRLDLVDRGSKVLCTEILNIVQEVVTKTIPEKKKFKKAKWLSEEALQIAEKEENRKAEEKGQDIPN